MIGRFKHRGLKLYFEKNDPRKLPADLIIKMKNPPHPGVLVSVDGLDRSGLTVTKAAKRLNVSRSALNNLVNEKADLSWEMAVRLSKAFGGTPEGWMRGQFQYEAAQVEKWAKGIRLGPASQTNGVGDSNIPPSLCHSEP